MKLITNVFNENMIEKINSLQRVSHGFNHKILKGFFYFLLRNKFLFIKDFLMRISTYLKKVTLPEGSNGRTLEVKRWAVSIARGRPRI